MGNAARKTVTVLFCDLVDSTPLGSDMDPEALRALYERYYEASRAAIERHGGTVEKYIGDAVMAVFGIPAAHEDDALRGVRAALEVRDESVALGLTPRLGIETGEVVAGDASQRHAFAHGPVVVVAERLEKAAGAGELLVGEAAWGLVRDVVDGEPVGPLALKGREEPVRAWRVHTVAAEGPVRARRLDMPLVGREREVALLEEELRRTIEASRCRLVSVLGAAGIGKTRLALEFSARVGRDARVVVGRCPRYGAGATYRPVLDVLAALPDVDLDERVRRTLSVLAGRESGTTTTEETFWAVRKAFEAAARAQPLVVVFDDVEWAEPTLLDLVDYLVGFSSVAPILLVCLARSELLEARPDWHVPRPETSAVFVEALPEHESERLLAALAEEAELDGTTAAHIVATAAGNPLFIEELLRMLVEEGVLRKEDGRWAVERDVAHAPVPASVQAVLAARLDRLPPGERAVIQAAATLGDEFWWGAVAALADSGGASAAQVHRLARKQLIEPTESRIAGEDAFRFRHPLIREAAYESLPKARRAELHRAAAEWLAPRVAAAEWDEVLGTHHERAATCARELGGDDRDAAARAVALFASAARRALLRGDAPSAAMLLERATRLDDERLDIAVDHAVALREGGDLEASAAVAAEAAVRAAAVGDAALEARARLEAVRPLIYTDPEHGLGAVTEIAAEVLPILAAAGDDVGAAIAEANVATMAYAHGRWSTVVEHVGSALERALRVDDARLVGELARMLAPALVAGPMPAEEAITRCRELQELTDGQTTVQCILEIEIAQLEAMLGRSDEAQRRARAVVETLEELGSFWATPVRGFAAYVAFTCGDARGAEELARPTHEQLAAAGDRVFAPAVAAVLAEALLAQGRVDEARAAAAAGDDAAIPGDRVSCAMLRHVASRIEAAAGDATAAERLAREAVELADEVDDPTLRGAAHEALAIALELTGRTGEARDAAALAAAAYTSKDNRAALRRLSERLPAAAPAR